MANETPDAGQPMPDSAGQVTPDAEAVAVRQDAPDAIQGSQLRILRSLGRAVAAALHADLRATRQSREALDSAAPD